MKTYNILDLIPQELRIKTKNLGYYAKQYKKYGRIYLPKEPPMVDIVDTRLYLSDGNQRAIFYLLNGIHTIDTYERVLAPDDEDIEDCEIIAKKNRSNGVHSFQDLVARIRNTKRFMVRLQELQQSF